MKNRSMTLFGLPTLLTVFIVIIILSFATLSLLAASGDRNALYRTNTLIGASYEIETMSEQKIADFTQEMSELWKKSPKIDEALAKFLKVHPEITYNKTTRYLQFTLAQSILSMDIVLQVSESSDGPILTRISYRLTTQNGQDYSQDGDPVWGG